MGIRKLAPRRSRIGDRGAIVEPAKHVAKKSSIVLCIDSNCSKDDVNWVVRQDKTSRYVPNSCRKISHFLTLAPPATNAKKIRRSP